MDELKKFFRLLMRYRITLITVPLITIIITYFLVRNIPDAYVSQAQISTGIVDETQQSIFSDNVLQESKINQEFSNLITMIYMKKIIDQVSYQLLIHDLTSKKPFRKPSSAMKDLNAGARRHAYEVFTEKYRNKEGLDLNNPDQSGLYNVLRSMNYDEGSIKQNLTVYRAGISDFITVEFSSENPELSAFLVNTLCSEFTTYYTSLVKENERRAVDFLKDLLKEKSDTLNKKVAALRSYKIQNQILNLNEQSSQLYSQTLEYESRKQQAEKDILSYRGAIASIDRKFDPKDRMYIEATQTRINQDIMASKEELRALYDRYVQSGFDEAYKKSIDSIKRIITVQISNSNDKYITNPLNDKQSLIQQKLTLQTQYDLALYGLGSLNKTLEMLNQKLFKLAPHEAVVQSYERDIDIASKEYLEILNKYNQSNLESNFSVKLRQAQIAMPGQAQPSKKMLLVILSGIISLVFCLITFFVLFFLDNAIKEPKELATKAGVPVLGYLNVLNDSVLDLKKLWSSNHDQAEQQFKDLLRSIRFEIERAMGADNILLVTSITPAEGKTLFSIALAYAYTMTGKKVLLVDGNFNNPKITETIKARYFLEDYLSNNDSGILSETTNLMTILGNRGRDTSLLELAPKEVIDTRLRQLAGEYDLIIIEAADLKALNKATEWTVFADKIVAVFEAGKSLSEIKKSSIGYLKQLDNKFIGFVLNKVSKEGKKAPGKKTWFWKKKQ